MPEHYIGIDPGFTGAIAYINPAGDQVWVWDMPTRMRGDTKKYRAYDLQGVWDILHHLYAGEDVVYGLENPTSRPGDGAERMLRFGRGIGNLEALIFALTGTGPELVAPQLWKSRLGLKGKEKDEHSDLGVALFRQYYPSFVNALYGPRGGLKDGRLDALLIAHWLRTRSLSGMAGVVEQFGRDSTEAAAIVLSGGRKKRRKKI